MKQAEGSLPMVFVKIVANLEAAGVASLARAIARKRGMTLGDMWARRRLRFQAHARQEFWAVLRGTDPEAWSYPRIGALSGHDHTTVMSGEREHVMRLLKSLPDWPIGTVVKVAAAVGEEKCA
jgi:chromosomal replication initiation ATPase DnaA